MHITHPFYIDVLLISPQQLVEFIVQHVKTNNSQMERIKKNLQTGEMFMNHRKYTQDDSMDSYLVCLYKKSNRKITKG